MVIFEDSTRVADEYQDIHLGNLKLVVGVVAAYSIE